MCEHRTISLLTGLCFDCGRHCLSIKIEGNCLSATARMREIDGVPTKVPERLPGIEERSCGCVLRGGPQPVVEMCLWHRRCLG